MLFKGSNNVLYKLVKIITRLNGIMARDRSITTDDIKQYYFKMPRSHRSIRRLYSELKEKFPKKKIPSLATIFRHSKQEGWIHEANMVDVKTNEKTLDKIAEKKSVELTDLTDKLKATSNEALQKVLTALQSGIVSNLEKPSDLLNMTKVGVESSKLANLLEGNPTSISGNVAIDTDDVVALKKHIADLYQSINDDLFVKQQEEMKKKFN